jgi:hypothetical protein
MCRARKALSFVHVRSANDGSFAAQSIVAHPVHNLAFLAQAEAVDLALKPTSLLALDDARPTSA